MQKKTPRQLAIDAGNAWYTPDHACPHCGLTAPKRVNNGQCMGCNERPRKAMTEPPAGILMSAALAKRLGYSMYTTGKPCAKGHTGPRYVNNRHCVQCQSEK